jgi:Polyketide cyclase / dehydrase and lipid transport
VNTPRLRGLIASLLLFVLAAPGPARAGPLPLTNDQQRNLERGAVVVLEALPPGASRSSQGGTAVARVNASPETVWRIIVDYRGHAGLYPRVIGAEVLESSTGADLVRYVVGIGAVSFGFHINAFPDVSRRRLGWRLAPDRPNGLFTDNVGYWEIEPGPEGVLLTYAMAARTVLPSFVTRSAERDGLVETIKAVRRRAEETR